MRKRIALPLVSTIVLILTGLLGTRSWLPARADSYAVPIPLKHGSSAFMTGSAMIPMQSSTVSTFPPLLLSEEPSTQVPQAEAILLTRNEIIARAQEWVDAGVPYDRYGHYLGYREDCSGYVSYAWELSPPGPDTVGLSQPSVSCKISKDELLPGDIVNNDEYGDNGHVLVFAGWADEQHDYYNAYEENPYWNGAHLTQSIPWPFWSGYYGTYYAERKLVFCDDETGSVGGVVRDIYAQPVAGAEVTFFGGDTTLTTTANTGGQYQFNFVPAGSAVLEARLGQEAGTTDAFIIADACINVDIILDRCEPLAGMSAQSAGGICDVATATPTPPATVIVPTPGGWCGSSSYSNLIVNGGFEMGSLSGWQPGSGGWQVTAGDAHSGNYKLMRPTYSRMRAQIRQSVNVSSCQGLINQGVAQVDAGFFCRRDEDDEEATAYIQFRSGTTVLDELDSAQSCAINSWADLSEVGMVPAGTDNVNLVIEFYDDGEEKIKADDAYIKIRFLSTPTSTPTPTNTPVLGCTPTQTRLPTGTSGPPSPPPTVTPSNTSTPAGTPIATPTATSTPTLTRTPSATATPTRTYTPTPTPDGSFSCTSVTEIPQLECEALVALYGSTAGSNWTNHSGWLTTNTPCSWYGVTCTSGHVTSIDLHSNQLSGSIPPGLSDLTQLSYLSLYTNQLSSSIPPQLGNLANLQRLFLDDNQLSGSIPPEMGNLADLQRIWLNGNQLSGNIPPELGNLANLKYLLLDDNQLSGSIPPELGNLTQLNYLYLYSNQLSGSIPPGLGNLTNLWRLYLSSNQLSGSIPSQLGNLANLESLWLDDNQLSGNIPPQLGNLASLQSLFLEENQLSGSIPSELGNLTHLSLLRLNSNQLSGSIPPGLGNLANLQQLYLHSNQLSGGIPSQLGNLVELNYLYLDSNRLSGSIPPQLGSMANVRYLSLSVNQLSGGIPPELANLSSLQGLSLSANQLSGSIPPGLDNLTNLQQLYLYSNQLSGTVPDSLCNLASLYDLDLGYNKLTGAAECIASKDPDWARTQTVAPANLEAQAQSSSSVQISWTPILYIGDGGYYEISYATNAAGPFTAHGVTASKSSSSYEVTGLTAGTTYYFRTRTYTPAHGSQQNNLWSEYSQVASATSWTPAPPSTPTRTPTWTSTPSRTSTPTSTLTATYTATPTPTGTTTVTSTPTRTPSVTPTLTRTSTATPTPTGTTTVTSTPTRTPSVTPTPTRTSTATPTPTGTTTVTSTPTRTPSVTPTGTTTVTSTPTRTPSVTPTLTRTSTATPTPTGTTTVTSTPTRTPSVTPTPTRTSTATPTPTGTTTVTSTPTRTPSVTPTPTMTATQTSTPLPNTALVKIIPAGKHAYLSGGTFSVTLTIENVINLAAFQTELTYEAATVHVTTVALGPFLGSTGRTVAPVGPTIDNATGKVTFGAFSLGTQPGPTGAGVLATIIFQPVAIGATALHLQSTGLSDPIGNVIAVVTEDGQVQVTSCFGDFNGDNKVDIFDLQRAASHWNCRTGDTCYDAQFDTEPDGDIDVFDLQRIAAAWGTTCPAAAVQAASGQTRDSEARPEGMEDGSLSLLPANQSITAGAVFTETFRLQDAENVGAFQTTLSYDPAIAQADMVTIGSLLASTGRTVVPVGPAIDNVGGRITFGAFTFGSQPGVSGVGDLAYVRFRARANGQTMVSFQEAGLGDPQGNSVPVGSLIGAEVNVGISAIYLPLVLR